MEKTDSPAGVRGDSNGPAFAAQPVAQGIAFLARFHFTTSRLNDTIGVIGYSPHNIPACWCPPASARQLPTLHGGGFGYSGMT
jgi:hypothetical protein